MKKIFLILLIVIILSITNISAQTECTPPTESSSICGGKKTCGESSCERIREKVDTAYTECQEAVKKCETCQEQPNQCPPNPEGGGPPKYTCTSSTGKYSGTGTNCNRQSAVL